MKGGGRERWRVGDGEREGQRESNDPPSPESPDHILSSDSFYLFCVISDNFEYDLTLLLFHPKVTNFLLLSCFIFVDFVLYFDILNRSLFFLLIYSFFLYL